MADPDVTTASGEIPAPDAAGTLIDRTLGNLRSVWRDIASSARETVVALRAGRDEDRWREQMQACLDGRGGEVSARARAAELGRTYLGLDSEGRRRFLILLARDFDVDRAAVDRAVEIFHRAEDPVARGRAERALRHVLEPGRVRLLTQFNGLPEGVKFLVDLRAELIRSGDGEPLLAALEADLKSLLRSWFDVGFLELRRITWDSPASLLEKLVRYEAVHAFRGWEDLKDRLDRDRRCFGFFHPRMPDEPLIFVEVALVEGISASVQALLDEAAPALDPGAADTAIFYSISNCQPGLAGISFGNFLIKRVVDLLQAELPNVRSFATLSPIPGFRRWLDAALARDGDGLLAPAEAERLREVVPATERPMLTELLARRDWHSDAAAETAVKPVLLRLGAQYLVNGRQGQRALDPVAHFHLTNGARVERLNWLADRSGKGLTQSAGMMVNYAYRLGNIDSNHESYTGDGKVIASSGIKALLKAPT